MTNRERFNHILNFRPADRLPVTEWATWWDKTIDRWHAEGLPRDEDIFQYFEIEKLEQFWLRICAPDCPEPEEYGKGILEDEKDYENILPFLYSRNAVNEVRDRLKQIKPLHDRGDFAVWITLEGFFWFPRRLFGIENHLYSFYDHPELYHRICSDLADFHIRVIEEFCSVLVPDFMTFAEDMSYNHGPMVSKEIFDTFLKPYYRKVIPYLKRRGVKVFVDSDGNVLKMIPWLREAGIEGVLPLERQAGVDVNEIRRRYPDFLMIGGFDKMVMDRGEAAVRAEFERILPAMKSGGYIPGVDHQTPPNVSIDDYKQYLRIFREYACRCGGGAEGSGR